MLNSFSRYTVFPALLALSLTLSGCSVFMAARKCGVQPTSLANCCTRSCLINKGARPIATKTDKKGVVRSEFFRAYLPTGSTTRAVMHGLLDLSTLGFWELIGTPIELEKSKKVIYTVEIFYDQDGETIKSVRLVN